MQLDTLVTAKATADAAYIEHIRAASDAYRVAIDRFVEAEIGRLVDPLNEAREELAKDARAGFEKAQQEFDSKVKGAKGTRTRALNDLWSDAVKVEVKK